MTVLDTQSSNTQLFGRRHSSIRASIKCGLSKTKLRVDANCTTPNMGNHWFDNTVDTP